MLANFIFFLISILGIGFLVGRRLVIVTQTTHEQEALITSPTGWYRINVAEIQKYLWLTFLFFCRYVLVVTIIRALLFIEKGSRILAQKLHTIIEKTMKYHHVHH